MNVTFSPRIHGPAPQPILSPVIERPDRRLSFRRRLQAYIRRPRLEGSFRRAMLGLLREWWVAQIANLREWRMPEPRLLQSWPGEDDLAGAKSIAIYIHYSPANTVSDMVIRQLEEYRAYGFTIIFVSMCQNLQAHDLLRLRHITGLVLRRRNFSLDFGAWHDIAPLLRKLTPTATELLLVNDSVCGPLRQLDGAISSMRASGEGLFGLTENLAPRPHLQSYFMLARGTAAISDLLRFMEMFRPTAYKRAVIRRGEVRLTAWMRTRGHLVAARHSYETVEWLALRRPRTLRRLRTLFPALAGEDTSASWSSALQHLPLNPTHSLWYELVECCDFPFLKTDLLIRNPVGIPDVADWCELVSLDRHELQSLIDDHLDQMTRSPRTPVNAT